MLLLLLINKTLTWGLLLNIDCRKSRRALPNMVIHYVIREIYFKLPHEIFKAFHLSYFCSCDKIREDSGFLTRTISQSTFNSAATASIFSLQTEPRLVMPLSQYFFRVAKSRSLNCVRSCNCKIKKIRLDWKKSAYPEHSCPEGSYTITHTFYCLHGSSSLLTLP